MTIGHTSLGKRVRTFHNGEPVDGRITKWLPKTAEDPALFHMEHDVDSDAEDLEEHELDEAQRAFTSKAEFPASKASPQVSVDLECQRGVALRVLLGGVTDRETIVAQCELLKAEMGRTATMSVLRMEKTRSVPLWTQDDTEYALTPAGDAMRDAAAELLKADATQLSGGTTELSAVTADASAKLWLRDGDNFTLTAVGEAMREGAALLLKADAELVAAAKAPQETKPAQINWRSQRMVVFRAVLGGATDRRTIVAQCELLADMGRDASVTLLGKEKKIGVPLWTQDGNQYTLTAAGEAMREGMATLLKADAALK